MILIQLSFLTDIGDRKCFHLYFPFPFIYSISLRITQHILTQKQEKDKPQYMESGLSFIFINFISILFPYIRLIDAG